MEQEETPVFLERDFVLVKVVFCVRVVHISTKFTKQEMDFSIFRLQSENLFPNEKKRIFVDIPGFLNVRKRKKNSKHMFSCWRLKEPCRNVHTGSRQDQVPGPIVFYCTSPGPCTVQCEQAITVRYGHSFERSPSVCNQKI